VQLRIARSDSISDRRLSIEDASVVHGSRTGLDVDGGLSNRDCEDGKLLLRLFGFL
jgi:hypothetical protein